MPAYVVVEIEVTDPVLYEDYKKLSAPAVALYGGKYLARGGKTEALEDDWAPTRLVILEFPTLEQAKTWWNSPEYTQAKQIRWKAADTRMTVIEGLPG
jgi:uncharacterized protein (DUF1330 family)